MLLLHQEESDVYWYSFRMGETAQKGIRFFLSVPGLPGAAGAKDQVVELTLRSRNVGLGSGGRSGDTCPALRSQSRKVDTVRQQARKGAVPFRGQARKILRNGRRLTSASGASTYPADRDFKGHVGGAQPRKEFFYFFPYFSNFFVREKRGDVLTNI